MNLGLDFTLLTSRCRLRCPSEADFPHVFAATRYAGFNDGMLWDAPATFEEMQGPLRRGLAAWTAGTAYGFTVESNADAMFLGRVGIRMEKESGVWSIGFWTHPEQQGKGYASVVALVIVDFGFRQLQAKRIEACHALWNTNNERVLKKAGMKFVRFIPEGFQKRGRWVEENLLAIERSEWEARQG